MTVTNSTQTPLEKLNFSETGNLTVQNAGEDFVLKEGFISPLG
jgi:hypothetical protein